jgi:hypothetical protein
MGKRILLLPGIKPKFLGRRARGLFHTDSYPGSTQPVIIVIFIVESVMSAANKRNVVVLRRLT